MQTVVDKLAGYNYGANELPTAPVTVQELEQLKQTITLDTEDERYLRMAGEVLEDQTDSIVTLWRGVISSLPHLAYYFKGANGSFDEEYKAKVKERFKQWIIDVCTKPYDQNWLNYQQEKGLRHTTDAQKPTGNTDASLNIPMRYIIAFSAVVNDTIKPFLAKKGHSLGVIEKMHKAWSKAVLLHIAIWSRAYCAAAW